MSQSTILEINTGRVASVRLGPNEDLLEALEQAAGRFCQDSRQPVSPEVG